MRILEAIVEFILRGILLEVLGGIFSDLNNAILRLRGIETKTRGEIKLGRLKRRYENKTISIKSNYGGLKKGSLGTVLELIDRDEAFVEFEEIENILIVPLSELRLKRQIK